MRINNGLILVSLLLLTGCQNVAVNLTPPNFYSGKPVRTVSDCVPMALGVSVGDASAEEALKKSALKPGEPYDYPQARVTKIHSIVLHDYIFLMFGARCVEVTGE